jgi:hypothetical protein
VGGDPARREPAGRQPAQPRMPGTVHAHHGRGCRVDGVDPRRTGPGGGCGGHAVAGAAPDWRAAPAVRPDRAAQRPRLRRVGLRLPDRRRGDRPLLSADLRDRPDGPRLRAAAGPDLAGLPARPRTARRDLAESGLHRHGPELRLRPGRAIGDRARAGHSRPKPPPRGRRRRRAGATHDDRGLELGAVALVRKGQIPKTTSGKLRRRASADRWLAGEFHTVAR